MKLHDKVALITGAGSGLGRAGAILFAREGARVAVVDIDDEGGRDTVAMIEGAGGEATYIRTDVAVVSDLESMIGHCVGTYSKLNIFWHNAGIAGPGHLQRTTENAFDRCIDVHLKGAFFGSKAAIPEIARAGGGSILFTASVAGVRPSPSSPTYSIAKAGLVMLARCLAVDLARQNIRVNCVAPGPVKTGMYPGYISRDPDLVAPLLLEKRILEMNPLGRFGEPEEIASAALYLVSDDARYVTGVTLPVDGGMVAC